MRAITPTMRAIMAGRTWNVRHRVLVEDPDGVMRDITAFLGVNWFKGAEWSGHVDQPCVSGVIRLVRVDARHGISLAPAMAGSIANRNSAMAYAPFLKEGRSIEIQTAVVPSGQTPIAGDWFETMRGRIDWVRTSTTTNEIQLDFRDPGAVLLDHELEEARTYAEDAPVMMEDIIQQSLDDEHGVGVYPLYVPVPSATPMNNITVDVGRHMERLRDVAMMIGWDLRFEYDDAGVMRLTLREPRRDFEPGVDTPDTTFAANEYTAIPRLDIGIEDIRNWVRVRYTDVTTGERAFEDATDPVSILEYGKRFMELSYASDANINTASEAAALAAAARDDLSTPYSDHDADTVPLFWPAQVMDVYEFAANGKVYDDPQIFAVVGYTHTIHERGGTTRFVTKGKVVGAIKEWIRRSDVPLGTELPQLHDVGVSWDSGDDEYYLWALSLPWVTPDADVEFQIREVGGEYETVAIVSQSAAYNGGGYRIPEVDIPDYDSMRARLVHRSGDYLPGQWVPQDFAFTVPPAGGLYPGPPPVFSFGDYGDTGGGDATSLNGQPASFYLDLANHTGTLADARLSSNVALRDAANTFTQPQTLNVTGADSWWQIRGDAGRHRGLLLRTGSLSRWLVGANTTAETGGDAGSDFQITRYNDAGAGSTAALRIMRATGDVIAFSRLGLGNIQSNVAFNLTGSAAIAGSGTAQYGIAIQTTSGSDATTSYAGLYASARSAAAAYTVSNLYGIMAATPTIGAGSTATNTTGIYVASQVGGATTYGLRVGAQPVGASNYAIYTDAGLVRFGDDVIVGSLGRFNSAAAPATGNFLAYNTSNDNKWRGVDVQLVYSSGDTKVSVGTDGTSYSYIHDASRTGTGTTPAQPVELRVIAEHKSITLDWSTTPLTHTIQYRVDYSTTGAFGGEQVSVVTSSRKLVHARLTTGTTYYYRVRAEGGANGSTTPSLFSAYRNATTFPITVEANSDASAFGSIIAAEIAVSDLAAINANLGRITGTGLLQNNASDTLTRTGIRLSSGFALPSGWTSNPSTAMYLDLAATGTDDVVHFANALHVRADGSATFGGYIELTNGIGDILWRHTSAGDVATMESYYEVITAGPPVVARQGVLFSALGANPSAMRLVGGNDIESGLEIDGALHINGTVARFAGDVFVTGNLDATTITGTYTVNANTLVGTTLAANVVTSSLTTLGTLTGLTIGGNLVFTGASRTITGLTSVTATTFSGALSGNATSATTLATSRTLWGQSFNGSANVSGALTGVTTISMTGDLTLTGASSDVIVAATAKYRLDGSAAGNAFLYESSPDVVDLHAGVIAARWTTTYMQLASTHDLLLDSTKKLRLNGNASGGTYVYESDPDSVWIVAGSVQAFRVRPAEVNVQVDLIIPSGVRFRFDGQSAGDSYLYEQAADNVRLVVGGSERLDVTTSAFMVKNAILEQVSAEKGAFIGGTAPVALANSGGGYPQIGYNFVSAGSGNWNYRATDFAQRIWFNANIMRFGFASPGTAGNPAAFTDAMTLASSGAMVVGGHVTATDFVLA